VCEWAVGEKVLIRGGCSGAGRKKERSIDGADAGEDAGAAMVADTGESFVDIVLGEGLAFFVQVGDPEKVEGFQVAHRGRGRR